MTYKEKRFVQVIVLEAESPRLEGSILIDLAAGCHLVEHM